MKKFTIVTGGAGFIGSHLVKKLIKKGREVLILDDLSSGSIDNLLGLGLTRNDFSFKKIDLADCNSLQNIFKNASSVFHLAAVVGGLQYLHGRENAELRVLENNLAIDANVFRACQEQEVSKLIYASSVAVYDMEKQYADGTVFSEKDFSPLTKNNPKRQFKMYINPDGGYGLAKILAEIELCQNKKIKVGIARIFSAYGENEPLDEKAHVISRFIKKSLAYPKEDFIIWGSGKQSRDYIYVSDCAEALLRLEAILNDSPLIINLGSGKPTTIRELAKKIIAISGKKIKLKYDLKKPVGPISRTANMRRVKMLLDWQPETVLDEGLRRVYYWAEKKTTRDGL